jgi:hypothetical protein
MTGLMPDDPDPIPVGMMGTITHVTPKHWLMQQYTVQWDGPRSLSLLPDDPFEIVSNAL